MTELSYDFLKANHTKWSMVINSKPPTSSSNRILVAEMPIPYYPRRISFALIGKIDKSHLILKNRPLQGRHSDPLLHTLREVGPSLSSKHSPLGFLSLLVLVLSLCFNFDIIVSDL